MKEPKIRFKEFKGEWEDHTLGDFGHISMCKRIFKNQTSPDGEIPFYKIGTFGYTPDAYISRKLYEEYRQLYPFPHKGDILISAAGTIGRTVEYMGEDAYYQDSNIVWLNHSNEIDNKFLKYLYSHTNWNNLEGATIKRLYNSILLSTKSNCPSLSEQQFIASYFQHLDALIQSTTKKIESLKQVKAASLQSMFPQEGETTPRVRFKGFEGEWKKVKVRDIFYITRGYVLAMNLVSLTKNRINRYAVYSSQTKNNGLAGYYNNYLYEDSITWTTDGANAGDVNYRPGKFYCTNVCGVLISKEGYANKCIAECLNLVTKHYVSYVGNPKLMNNTMSEIEILIPPIQKEQQKISDYFITLDRQINLQSQRLEKLKQIKAACLDKMFV